MSWKKVKLGEICTITKGTTGIQKAIAGKFPLVVTGEERRTHSEYQFDDEAVLIPLVSSTGHGHRSLKRIHFQSGRFALGSILCAVIPKDKTVLNAAYLYHYLMLNKEAELVGRMRGMANVTLPVKEIELIEVPLPTLEAQLEFIERHTIAEEKATQLNTEFNNQLNLIKKLRQSLLQDAVQGRLVVQDGTEEPADMLLQKIKAEKAALIADKKLKKEKDLPAIAAGEEPFDLPAGWVWCRLGEIAYIASGSTPKQDAFVKEGVPYLKMYNLKKQQINFEYKPQFIKREIHEGQLKRSMTQVGDVIMNIVGPPLGKLAIIPSSLPECNFNQAGLLIRGLEKDMNKWFYWYLNEMSEINSISTKGMAGQDNISLTQTKSMRIPLPPLAEQQRIVAKLESLLAFCNGLEERVEGSRKVAELLLQTALREALASPVDL